MGNRRILKGNIIYTPDIETIKVYPNHYIVVEDGRVSEIRENLETYGENEMVEDFTDHLIIPGFVDLHVHASQYEQIGLGLDLQLIDWLNNYTFPSESKFQDREYAKEVYKKFADELIKVGTTRACIFATIHLESTKVLMNILTRKGIGAYVGKVNMDRNGREGLIEKLEDSLKDTRTWIEETRDNERVKPIITPRFAPSCSEELLKGLGELVKEYKLPVQSHLSENRNEVNWVKNLFPDTQYYSYCYDKYGLFGNTKTLMAHGIYLKERECDLIKNKNVTLVHCPDSNMNLRSGIMPIRRWLNKGMKIGLGSDVGAGSKLSMTSTIVNAIQNSKILWMHTGEKPLRFGEAFYLATKGGGQFFGKVGSFDKGYAFDALIIDMTRDSYEKLSPLEQLQRFVYKDAYHCIVKRICDGVDLN